MSDENTNPSSPADPAAVSPTKPDPTKNPDEVALELMKFIAVTTGYGKGSAAAAGFSGKPSRTSEEYTESLLQLFERCREVVAKPIPKS